MEEISVFPRGLTPFQRLLFLRKMKGGTPSELKTVSGSIIHITDALARKAKSLVVDVNPVQSGSGDPSPDNIRPITGWTGCKVWVDDEHDTSGEPIVTFIWGASFDDVTWTIGSFIAVDGSIGTNQNLRYSSLIPVTQGNWVYKYTHLAKDINTRIHGYDSSGNWTEQLLLISDKKTSLGDKTAEIIVPDDVAYLRISTGNSSNDTPISLSMLSDSDGIVCGGTLGVTTGVLIVTDANIESYNGETLPSTWISDRDVYAQGTTPTTGAQVVYKLATPLTYQLTPTQVQLLLGENYVWADTGDCELKYYAEVEP